MLDFPVTAECLFTKLSELQAKEKLRTSVNKSGYFKISRSKGNVQGNVPLRPTC